MARTRSPASGFTVAALRAHLRQPLYRNGYALIISALVTSGLGIVYWALAAKYYSTVNVGLNSAAISSMMLLSGVSQLNLMGALIRFLPRAGRSTGKLVRYVYVTTLLVSALFGIALVLVQGAWAPVPKLFKGDEAFLVWFIVATMAWGVFALQDFVLTGLRQAKWVPIENFIFAIVKIVLLVALAGRLQLSGIFVSWTVPTLVAVVAMNALIFGRLIPRHVSETQHTEEPIQPRRMLNYVAGNYVGYLFFVASTTLLPILVERISGASATAYFYLAWIFAYSLQLVSQNMSASLTVEGAIDEAALESYVLRVMINIGRIVVPVVAVFLIGAPYILQIFGTAYSDQGAGVLRLLALAAIPNIINTVYIAMARVRQRNEIIIVVQAALCIIALGLSAILLGPYGIVGVGIAWLVSQTLVAAVLILTELRPLFMPPLERLVSRVPGRSS